AVLADRMTGEFFDAGLTARLLVAMPPRRPKVWSEAEVGKELKAEVEKSLDHLLALNFGADEDGDPVPVALNWDAVAKHGWVRFSTSWARRQCDAEGALAAALAKLEGYAARFALLHHAATHAAIGAGGSVGVRSVRAGIALAEWFGYETERVYRMLGEAP